MHSPRSYAGISGEDRRADRRQRLIESAHNLLADGGPAAITVTKVCKDAGLTPRYFYEHFGNREALIEAIVDLESDLMISVTLDAILSTDGDPKVRAEAGMRALLAALTADPRATRIARDKTHDEVVLRMRPALAARLTAALAEHAAIIWPDTVTHPQRVLLASSLAIGGALQLIDTWLQNETDLSRDDVARIAAEFAVSTGRAVLASGLPPANSDDSMPSNRLEIED